MKRLLIFLAILLVAAFALSSANAEHWYRAGYYCDGCRTSANEIVEPWAKVYVPVIEEYDSGNYRRFETLHYCGECRVNPEQQRKLGANLMKNGRWVKE